MISQQLITKTTGMTFTTTTGGKGKTMYIGKCE
jgi:hypothetical protein